MHGGIDDALDDATTPTPYTLPPTMTTTYSGWMPRRLSHWRERELLSTAYRALAAQGLNAGSGLGSHLTMSVGDNYTDFLVVRYGLHWFEVTAENLVLVDNDGNLLEGEGPVQGAAVALHGPVHKEMGPRARVRPAPPPAPQRIKTENVFVVHFY